MKSRVFAIAVLALTVALLCGGVFAADEYVGETRAKSIALTHAGVTGANATFLRVHLDYDDGRVVYDVEFYSGSTEYDYEIDAVSGDIREYDRDIEYYSIPSRTRASTYSGQYIGEAEAKAKALGHAGVTEANATFVKAYLDDDDGHIVYDVEFYSGNTEYDYEIDAVNGNIHEYDTEIEYYSIPANTTSSSAASRPTGNYIGDARAKEIALDHAGVTESVAAFIRAHLDYDDGRVDYEVEFYSGNTEYGYEIDAVSGRILEYDRDAEYYSAPRGNASASSSRQPASSASGDYISEARAKEIALNSAGLSESQVSRFRIEFDRDDGRSVYEIEFNSGRTEYEYEIDAVSGAVMEYSSEYDD